VQLRGPWGAWGCHDYHNYVVDDIDAVRVNYGSHDLCGAFVIIATGFRRWNFGGNTKARSTFSRLGERIGCGQH
jgi:hypothetical protein